MKRIFIKKYIDIYFIEKKDDDDQAPNQPGSIRTKLRPEAKHEVRKVER